MALLVEDGAGIPAAETYATESELVAYATARGTVLSSTDEAYLSTLLVKAMDYLEGLSFDGEVTDPDQVFLFPRKGVFIRGVEIASNVIPARLKAAQMQLAIEADTVDLAPTTGAGRDVVKEKVDVIELTYDSSEGATSSALPTFAKVDSLLADLIGASGGQSVNFEVC